MKKNLPNSQSASIEIRSDGNYDISGDLSFETVSTLWQDSKTVFRNNGPLIVDLRQVSRSDSAGLALLLEWIRMARKTGQSIAFHNIPDQLQNIARVSGIDALLSSS
ncbi:MAG: STAS domain-containing protein [Gammaproteobacteria bacterium]|nr:STAS domain-containing protein [Gammaproteobacteria bacterium]